MTTVMVLSLGQLLTYGCVVALVAVAVAIFAFTIEDAISTDQPEQSCSIHPDQWGLYCSAHNLRVSACDACPKRKENQTWM